MGTATTYTAKRGYGWVTKEKLLDCLRTPWHQKGTVVSVPDDLWGDFVFSRQENAFHADLPNGRYEVAMLIGDVGSAYGPHHTKVRSLYPSSSIIVKANGKVVIRKIIDERNILDIWYQNEHTEYRRGDDPWTTYIESKLRPQRFKVRVTDGKLRLAFWRDCRIAGMFIHPAAKSRAFGKWYEAQGPARKKAFLSRYDEIKNIPKYAPIPPTAEDRERHYAVFSRDHLEDVFPNSRPAPDEREIDFNIFAARGEREPVTFSVKPLWSLKGVRVTCGDLAGPAGARIPASAWDVRHIRYLQIPNHTTMARENRYRVEGRLLDRREKKDFEAGVVRRVWLTLRVPKWAKAGVYKGAISFKPENAPETQFPVTVRVLPFELEEPKDVAIGIFYSPASPWRYYKGKKDDLYFKDVRASLRLLREHGFTSVAHAIDRPTPRFDKKTGKATANMVKFDRFFKVFKEAGMSMTAPFFLYGNDGGSGTTRVQPSHGIGWIPKGAEKVEEYLNPEWTRKFRAFLRYQVEYGRRRGWPPLVFCVHDEVHGWSQKKLDGMAKILEATYMQEPDVKSGGCINTPEGTMLVPYHDYPMYNSGVPFSEESLALVKKHGKTMTIDNFGQLRWNIGFWMWRVQPKVAADSFFCWVGADPYNPFDDVTASELAVAYPGRRGWVATPTLARMGEGIDDYKYAFTLQQAIRRAEAKGGAVEAVARGKATLRFLNDFVDVRLKRYVTNGTPSQEVTDKLRRRVAWDIAALHGDELPVPDDPKPDTRWWNTKWRYRIPLHIEAGLQTRRDVFCVAEVDLAAAAAAVGVKRLSPDSLRLVAGDGEQTLVPFSLERGAVAGGGDRLIWKAPGRTSAMTSRWFYLYADAVGARKRPRPAKLKLRARDVPGINLLSNGGFEDVKEGTDEPAGWTAPAAARMMPGHGRGASAEDKKSGARSLKLVQDGKSDPKKAHAIVSHPSVRVVPDRKYRLSAWIKRAQGESHTEVMLHWQGKDKRNLGNRKFDAYTKLKHDWKFADRTATAPQNAHFADVQAFIWPHRAAGVAYFDDIRLELLSKDGAVLPEVITGKIETRNDE